MAAINEMVYRISFSTIAVDRPLIVLEVQVPRISRQSVHEGSKVVSSTHRPPLPPGRIPGTHFC
jgi:hypothetical protein